MNYTFHLPARFIVAAVILDFVLGDPDWLPHPVVLIGRFTAWGDRHLHSETSARAFVTGTALAVAVVMLTAVGGWILITASQSFSWMLGALVATLIGWMTLAVRGLNDAALAVERCIACNDDNSARRRIRALVGRDPEVLNRRGLIAATIESVAENSSDGAIAPLFFLFLGGPVTALAYKAINTLDSMLGYKDERYLYFGRCAARLDDIANLLPARLTAVSIALAAAPVTGRTLSSLRTCLMDARRHESPNAGYPEAAMAGALGVQLGGDAYYDGELEHRPKFGRAQAPLDLAALRNSRTLMWTATLIALTFGIVLRSLGAGI